MMNRFDEYAKSLEARYGIENLDEWDKWKVEIPFLKFPSEWHVKIIPPFTGAIIRFWVKKDLSMPHPVSVYLDCYDRLGCCGGKPYWEVYPDMDGGTSRHLMNETEDLIQTIGDALKVWEKKNGKLP